VTILNCLIGAHARHLRISVGLSRDTHETEDDILPHPVPPAASPAPDGGTCDGYVLTAEDQMLALLLITVWAARTGRALRTVPVSELSLPELVNFWADDQLEPPLDAPVCQWLPR